MNNGYVTFYPNNYSWNHKKFSLLKLGLRLQIYCNFLHFYLNFYIKFYSFCINKNVCFFFFNISICCSKNTTQIYFQQNREILKSIFNYRLIFNVYEYEKKLNQKFSASSPIFHRMYLPRKKLKWNPLCLLLIHFLHHVL